MSTHNITTTYTKIICIYCMYISYTHITYIHQIQMQYISASANIRTQNAHNVYIHNIQTTHTNNIYKQHMHRIYAHGASTNTSGAHGLEQWRNTTHTYMKGEGGASPAPALGRHQEMPWKRIWGHAANLQQKDTNKIYKHSIHTYYTHMIYKQHIHIYNTNIKATDLYPYSN